MKYTEFLDEVQRRTGLNERSADNAVRAFMGVLAERLPKQDVSKLAAQLPEELQGYLSTGESEKLNMTAFEFYERIAGQEGVDHETARRHSRAVWRTVDLSVKAHEMGHVLGRLPGNLATDLSKNQ